MRHKKKAVRLGRTSAHFRCLIANMLKSLVERGRIETTVTKGKELRRHADHLITLAKKGTLASRKRAIAELMIRYNPLTPKEKRLAKGGRDVVYNTDRKVIRKLFEELSQRYSERQGGYTRIVRKENRKGDGAPLCIIEYLP